VHATVVMVQVPGKFRLIKYKPPPDLPLVGGEEKNSIVINLFPPQARDEI